MLEENLGKLLVISRTISQAFYQLTFPASHLSYLKQQLLTLTKVLNWKTKDQKSQSPKACSHSQAQRNSLYPFPFRFLDLLPNGHERKKTGPTVRDSNKAHIYFGCLLVLLSLGRVYQTFGLEFTDYVLFALGRESQTVPNTLGKAWRHYTQREFSIAEHWGCFQRNVPFSFTQPFYVIK